MVKHTKVATKRRSKKKPATVGPAVVYCQNRSASTLLLGMFMGWQLKRLVTWLNKSYSLTLDHQCAKR